MCLWKRERTYLFLPFGTTLVRRLITLEAGVLISLKNIRQFWETELAWIPWLGHIAVCYHLMFETTLTLNADGTYLLIQSYNEK